jgi:hypothetical protein
MRFSLKRNAVVVSGLTIFFWWSFEFAKHHPSLRGIIPFGEDPYDAVSSFGVIAAILLAFVSFVRVLFPRIVGRRGRSIYVLRAQLAIPFCVLVTLVAEAVAMVRHTTLWVGMSGSSRLLILLAAQAVFAFSTLILLLKDVKVRELRLLVRPIIIWMGTIVALAIYPEQLILRTPGHLFTVIFGAACLFAPVSALIQASLPEKREIATSRQARAKAPMRYAPLAVSVAVGLLVGVGAYVAELGEGDMRTGAARILFVSCVYMGLGASGLLIGYLCLGRLLGFTIGEPHKPC